MQQPSHLAVLHQTTVISFAISYLAASVVACLEKTYYSVRNTILKVGMSVTHDKLKTSKSQIKLKCQNEMCRFRNTFKKKTKQYLPASKSCRITACHLVNDTEQERSRNVRAGWSLLPAVSMLRLYCPLWARPVAHLLISMRNHSIWGTK